MFSIVYTRLFYGMFIIDNREITRGYIAQDNDVKHEVKFYKYSLEYTYRVPKLKYTTFNKIVLSKRSHNSSFKEGCLKND